MVLIYGVPKNQHSSHEQEGLYPTGFKSRISYQRPTVVPGGDFAKTKHVVCMISNNRTVSDVFNRIDHKCMPTENLYTGMKVKVWKKVNSACDDLEKDYEEVGQDA
ncbi:tubulin alpha-5 chain [Artemisia annua]|uniref:Tubulin alpha-5 chain n=1 Tax=Artemisia annua TaxID=35608 RepID=A0A2U1KWX1_ARTAN|nr:tubulin alpha-5 chain [Artemisia annua]